MRSNPTPADFNHHHSDPDNFVIDQWCAQNIYQALAHPPPVVLFAGRIPPNAEKRKN
jgi:hypothetical protein